MCRQPHIPAPARSLPPPHARLSPSSRRPRSPRRAEPPRRPSRSPSQSLGFGLQLSCSLFTLPLRLSRRRLRLSGEFVSISRSVSPGSSSLTRVIFQSQTPRTFPSLSVLTWVEGPTHPSRPHLSHPRGRGHGGSCLSACPSPPWSLRRPINFPPAAAGFHQPSPPPTSPSTASPGWDTLCPLPLPRLPAVVSEDREQEAN